MRVILLAAGFGTRLYPITRVTAKALVDLGDKPILDHVMSLVETIKDKKEVVIVTNGKFFNDFSRWKEECGFGNSVEIINNKVLNPNQRLGAVRDLLLAMQHRNNSGEDFLVISPDNYFDFSVSEFLHQVRTARKVPLIGVYDLKNRARAKEFGVIQMVETGEITDFEEKPLEPKSSLISIGLYYLPQEFKLRVREYLEIEKQDPDRIGDFIKWLTQRAVVYGHVFSGHWFDVGNVYDLQAARQYIWEKRLIQREAVVYAQ